MGKKKHTYEFVKKQIEKEGYILLSKEYINAHSKLKVMCPKGHEYKTVYNAFQQGKRCPECFGTPKHTYEHIKEHIEKEGYELLSKTYKNSHTKLRIKCPESHEYKVRWSKFQRGQRCSGCVGGVRLTYEHVKEQIEKEGYKLLSKEYKNVNTKLKVKCPKGHEYKTVYNAFQQGHRCPECYKNQQKSKAEIDIVYFINMVYDGVIVENDRTQILNTETGWNLELDIWLPKLKKAIEFNGGYWHSFYDKKRRDKIKKQQCLEKGIDLMVIHEEHWNFNKEKCLNKIQEFIEEIKE